MWCHFGILWAHNLIWQWIDTSLATGGHTRTEQRERGGHPSIKISAINASSVEWLMGLVPGRAHVCGAWRCKYIPYRRHTSWSMMETITTQFNMCIFFFSAQKDSWWLPIRIGTRESNPPQHRRNGGLCLDFLHFHTDAHLVWSMGYVCLHATVNLMTFPILCVQDRSCFRLFLLLLFLYKLFRPFKFLLLLHHHISKLAGRNRRVFPFLGGRIRLARSV